MAWGLAIGAGVGLLKNELIDKPKARKAKELQAKLETYSPWTGVHGRAVDTPDTFESMLKYGATGASMARGIKHPSSLDSTMAPVSASAVAEPQVGDYATRQSP